MVYIKSWTDFESAAIELYGRSPKRVRYCVKFERPAGRLVLKVTDDVSCIKYKTHSAIILNRFEALNLRMVLAMGQPRARKRDVPTIPGAAEGDVKMAGPEAALAPATPASTPSAAGKKKKKGKK